MRKIYYIVGARPQFMQASMVSKALLDIKGIDFKIIHTGQHFDKKMSDIFFDELEIPKPYKNLNVNTLNHGAMVGRIMERLEELLISERPEFIIVDGDTNSTLAGALVAAKLKIKSLHIEAGMRSFDMAMPEEINRIMTDNGCTYLYCPTETAYRNLKDANLDHKARIVGDVLYDAFSFYRPKSEGKAVSILKEKGLTEDDFILLTIHREENLENRQKMAAIFQSLSNTDTPILFPVHPRTEQIINKYDIDIKGIKNIYSIKPVGYLEMLDMEINSSCIITDSGGVQREAYWSKKPVFILRNTTEWVEQLETGWAILVRDADLNDLPEIISSTISSLKIEKYIDFYGDGSASYKIAKDIEEFIR